MVTVISRLGYGNESVTSDTFTRILNEQFYDTEEVRRDCPLGYSGTYEYIGIANTGSVVSDSVWNIVRLTWMNNRCVRKQYQANVAWANRFQGWSN